MPAGKLQLDMKGMVTATGALAVPPGSVIYAANFDFPAPGLAAKRVGIEATDYGFGGPCWSVITTKSLGANLLFNVGTTSGGTNLQYGTGDAVRTNLTTPDSSSFSNLVADARRMHGAVSLTNVFLTSSRATARLNSDYSLHFAGMARPKGIYRATGTTLNGSASWLAVNYGVAYRIVFGTTDADGVPILSPPSGRFIIRNIATTTGYTGAARGVTLRCLIPFHSDTESTAITTSYFIQVYRSIAVDSTVGEPGDEMQLCYQAALTGAQIVAGVVDVTDLCPEAALGTYLYTNTVSGGDVSTGLVRAGGTGLGIAASNDRPPIALDVAQFGNCLWYANIKTPQRLLASIVAVGAGGVAVGDVLTIGGQNFTGVVGAPATLAEFKVETGLGSTARNIQQTACNLCEAVNAYTSQTTITATYVGNDSSPGTIGQILFEARRTDAASFGISTTGAAAGWVPQLASVSSSSDEWGNGLAVSKPFQGDSVPPANFLRVGRNDTVIQRVVPLRDALFIFTDDGIFWARGNGPTDFVVDSFDPTFRTLAPDAIVACGDAIYAWGSEGIARITNGGLEYIDLPIRNYMQRIVAGLGTTAPTNLPFSCFAVAWRVARRVLFFFPTGDETGGYACTRALMYDVATGAWGTYRYDKIGVPGSNGKMCGVVRYSDELLHLGEWSNGADTLLFRQRDSGDPGRDYIDTDESGNDQAIVSVLQWNATTPNPSLTCHWSELQCFWSEQSLEPGLASVGQPTSVSVSVTSEFGIGTTATLSPTSTQTRLLLSSESGIAARQSVTVTHGGGETCSVSGFALIYTPISNFNTR